MAHAQVFISYKSEEHAFACELRDHLHQWGFTTWLDRDNIKPGTRWWKEIDQGLSSSQIILALVTPDAVNSDNVLNEWMWALENRRLLLLIELKPTNVKAFHWLSSIQRLNFTSHHDFETLYSTLKNWEKLTQRMYRAQTMLPVAHQVTSADAASITKQRSKRDPRTLMLDKVEQFWIKGILEAEAGQSGAFTLGLEEARGMLVKHVRYDDYTFPNTDNILEVFEAMSRKMLILGTPGAGKTFLLLQLARHLIAKAHSDLNAPIPVVFNLSSWAVSRNPFDYWLVEQLHRMYGLSRRLARQWVRGEKLLLLLDGLDEVRAEYRDQCVDAINAFREIHRGTDFVVCSRLLDYETLISHLNLSGAITLQPLTHIQILGFTDHPELAALRMLLETDPIVRELAQTPFLLDTMAKAYHNTPPTTLQLALVEGNRGVLDDLAEARRIHLFERFIDRQLVQVVAYPPRVARAVLGWLAKALQNESTDRTTFYLEDLTPNWIKPTSSRLSLCFLSAILIAVPILLIYAVIAPIVMAGVLFIVSVPYLNGDNSSPLMVSLGETIGLFISSVVTPYLLPFASVVSLSFAFIPRLMRLWWHRLIACGTAAMVSIIVFAPFNETIFPLTNLIVAVILAVTLWLTPGSRGTPERLVWSWRRGLLVAAVAGIGLGLIPQLITYANFTLRPQDQMFIASVVVCFALGGLLIGGWKASPLDVRSRPNEGMRRAARNMIVISVSGILATAVANVPFAEPSSEGYRGMTPLFTLVVLIIFWTPTIFIPFALSVGGEALAAHFATRLALWRARRIPAAFSPFLDAMASVGLLRKIGGGYVFRHRYLLEYFARYEYKEER